MTHDAVEPGEPQPNRSTMPPLPRMPQPQQQAPSGQQAQRATSGAPQPHQPAHPQQDAQRQYGVPARGQSYGQPGRPGPGQPQQSPSLSSQLGGTAATQLQHPQHPPHAQGAAYARPAHPGAVQSGQATTSAAPVEPKRKRNRAVPWLVLGLPIMLVVGVVAGYLLATNYNSFDNRAVEDSVAQVLRNDYGLSDLRSVDCPNWIKVEQGQSFQCEFEYAGGTQTVTVTQGSQSGQLVVGAPE
ncbi:MULTISPECIES: DUF4333 domain-containing protein [Gulosibacter]|uniref:DUF4333 domain-containing protein n=1 Tax=Gulosibacter TaxID=256818 RepID=UPI000F63A853|nr:MULTISPECIES: DUF4333 domain-containing protein [Gulosibacter]